MVLVALDKQKPEDYTWTAAATCVVREGKDADCECEGRNLYALLPRCVLSLASQLQRNTVIS